MRRLLPISLAAAVALVPALLPACTDGGGEIVIGVIGPTSGSLARIGQAERRGADLAARDINATGGVGGKRIRIEFRDDAQAFQIPDILRELALSKKAAAIIGPETTTPVRNPTGPLAGTATPFLSITGEGGDGPRVFRLAPTAADQAAVLATWLITTRGLRRIAVAVSDDARGKAGADAISAALAAAGSPPVEVRTFPAGLPDPSPTVQALRAKHPAALVVWAAPDDAARLLRAVRDVGWGVQIAGPLDLFDPDYRSLGGARTDDTAFVLPFRENWFAPNVVQWFLGYSKDSGVLTIPKQRTLIPALPYLDMLAYDAVKVVAEAAGRAHSTDAAKVGAALQDGTAVDGVFGRYRFTAAEHHAFGPDALWVARFSNFAFLYDPDPRSDRKTEIASYKIQVSAYYVPQEFLRSPRGQRIQRQILEQVLTDPAKVQYFRAYRPPRPPPGPL